MREHFRSPLARWGFTVLAVFGFATAQPGPALVATVIAIYAWKIR